MYELNYCEKSYLKKVVVHTRCDYIRKNRWMFIEDNIDLIDEDFFIASENVERNFEIKSESDISFFELESVFGDEKIINIVKTLTLREKLVLFLYYFENRTDLSIGVLLGLRREAINRIRNNALRKIKNKYEKKTSYKI